MASERGNELDRRKFLGTGLQGAGATWIALHWPAVMGAARHAAGMRQAPAPAKLEVFTPDEAAEVEAITSRIIPSDDTPGAREAGVVYFIDRALMTFATDDQKTYREGLPAVQARVRELFPGVAKFSAATAEQQDQVLQSFDDSVQGNRRTGMY